MRDKCPGQDLSRKVQEEVSYDLPCPKCHSRIEFFYDDKKRICKKCGFELETTSEKLTEYFGCANWCKYAKECLGERLYMILREASEQGGRKK